MKKWMVFATLMIFLGLPACSLIPADTQTPPVAPSDIAQNPADFTQVITAPTTASQSADVTVVPPGGMIKIPLIAVGDDGVAGPKIGCGDSVVMVDRPFTGSDALVQAYTELLGIRERDYGESGLIDPLYQSTLTIKKISLSGGTAFVYLEGNFMLSGGCDNPRVQAQLEQTALQFPEVKSVQVFISEKTLPEALSLK